MVFIVFLRLYGFLYMDESLKTGSMYKIVLAFCSEINEFVVGLLYLQIAE